MSFERYKDIEINETKYRVEKFSAKIGMFIASIVFTKIAPLGLDKQIGINNLPEGRQIMTEQEFSDLIDYCMCACKRYEQLNGTDIALPIMARKGVWAIPDLEYDLTTVVSLCAHVLSFNISSFFSEGALKTLMESMKDIPLFNTQP
jgi:hypothetical protein